MLGHIKIRVDSLKGFRSYRGLKLAVRFPKNFKRPLAAKLWVVFEIVLGVQEWYGPPLSPCPVWWMRLRVPPGGNLYVLCLFDGHAFERLSLWTSLRHEGVGIQKQYRHHWMGEGLWLWNRVQLCLYAARRCHHRMLNLKNGKIGIC